MFTFILVYTLATSGQPPAQLGSYYTEKACKEAIRQIFLAKISPQSRSNQQVIAAIDTTIKYQQEYQCIPTGK